MCTLVGCSNENDNIQLATENAPLKVLIFSKTKGWRHKSIEPGIEHFSLALSKKGIQVVASEDAKIFNDTDLSTFSAVMFLNTTGDILNSQQQVANINNKLFVLCLNQWILEYHNNNHPTLATVPTLADAPILANAPALVCVATLANVLTLMA